MVNTHIEQPGFDLDVRIEPTPVGFMAYHGDRKVLISVESFRGTFELNIPAQPRQDPRIARTPDEAEMHAENLAREYFSGWKSSGHYF